MCNPFPILAFGIGRVQKMAKTVLRPAVVIIVMALAKQNGTPLLVPQKEYISLR